MILVHNVTNAAISGFSFSYLFVGAILQNLYWADSGDLVAVASDTSFYILKYNVRITFILRSYLFACKFLLGRLSDWIRNLAFPCCSVM